MISVLIPHGYSPGARPCGTPLKVKVAGWSPQFLATSGHICLLASTVLEFLSTSDGIDEVLAGYPNFTRDNVLACPA